MFGEHTGIIRPDLHKLPKLNGNVYVLQILILILLLAYFQSELQRI